MLGIIKDLIQQFVDSISADANVETEWPAFVAAKMTEELDQIIAEEGLKAEKTKLFVENAFRDGEVATSGMAITQILPPVSRFGKNGGHAEKKQIVLGKLTDFFNRFTGLI